MKQTRDCRMKKILMMITIVSSLNTFAECPIFIRNAFVNSGEDAFQNSIHQDILFNGLIDKGYTIVETEGQASQVLDFKAEAISNCNSIWEAKINMYSTSGHKGYTVKASERNIKIPLHVLTFGISTLIPTDGSRVMSKLVKKIPSCDQVKEDIKSEKSQNL